MSKFNLEAQYKLFLQRMGLNEQNMHPEQKIQLKQTFFGACGTILLLFRDDISELDEDKGVEAMQSMLQQVEYFFEQ